MCLKVISLEADRNGQETAFRGSGEAPGGYIYQGGGTQAGNEAVQRIAAGSSAWIRIRCRGADMWKKCIYNITILRREIGWIGGKNIFII